jgi:hypothetical protein
MPQSMKWKGREATRRKKKNHIYVNNVAFTIIILHLKNNLKIITVF